MPEGTRYKFHPIAAIFPLMDDDALWELRDDIVAHGLRQPIILFEDMILDGRNRATACRVAGIEPRFEKFEGNAAEAIEFVWSENRQRRHLDKSQLAMAEAERAAKVEEYAEVVQAIKDDAKDRIAQGGKRGGEKSSKSQDKARQQIAEPYAPYSKNAIKPADTESPDDRKTTAKRAKAAGTNRQYVADADRLMKEAPDLAEKVKNGELKITQAKLKLKRRQKRQQLEQAEAAVIETSWRIVNEDCLNALQEIDAGSVRLAFVDPPYNIGVDYGRGKQADRLVDADYLAWCREWMELCRDRLTDDGSLWVMINDEYAAEFAAILKDLGLHRRAWIKWYETFGVNCSNNFNRTSRHILYFVRDAKRFVFHPAAVSRPSDRQAIYNDKRASPDGKILDDVWTVPRLTGTAAERIPDFPTQIPLEIARRIVGCASDPGDLVLDPCCGSGTTGVASVELRRDFVGIEWEERFVELAHQRLRTTNHKETES